MTGYTVHTGSNQKYSQGWDQIFQRQAKAKMAQPSAKKSKDTSPPKAGQPRRKSK